jgi:uncharacterized membrane protein
MKGSNMPYTWTQKDALPDGVIAELRAQPHRSLAPVGFVWFIGITCALFALPLLAVLGSHALWGLLPFLGVTVWGMWYALHRNTHDGTLTEVLTISHDQLHLIRHEPRQADQSWEANPYWTQVSLHPEKGPVPSYLTMKGNNREVELGSFLTPEERKALHGELIEAINKANSARGV